MFFGYFCIKNQHFNAECIHMLCPLMTIVGHMSNYMVDNFIEIIKRGIDLGELLKLLVRSCSGTSMKGGEGAVREFIDHYLLDKPLGY